MDHEFEINHSFKTFEERIVIVVKDKDDDGFEILSSLSISGGSIYNTAGTSINLLLEQTLDLPFISTNNTFYKVLL